MSDKIIDLAKRSENSLHWTVSQMLAEEIEVRNRGERSDPKAVIIYLDDANQGYDLRWVQAGMSCSQMLALAEVFKMRVLQEMTEGFE
jgi:hypothetical protein